MTVKVLIRDGRDKARAEATVQDRHRVHPIAGFPTVASKVLRVTLRKWRHVMMGGKSYTQQLTGDRCHGP